MSRDLAMMSATDLVQAYDAGTISPVEAAQASLDQIGKHNEAYNAFVHIDEDATLASAKASEARWTKGAPEGMLDGLPVAIKDESYIAGKPTSGGSLIMKDFVAPTTSPMNERILAEGAIVHARTATPEFSCAGITWSRLWGVTRNPWNPEMTPGGSSGGSAASLALGTSSLATGSDIGGSIRIPASCCGLVGYKPPYGRNPDDLPFNLDFYCHTGPLARTVSDAILLQNIMCGPHPLDISTLYPKLTLPTEYPDIKGWKIALSMDLGSFTLDEDVRKNTLAAAETFRSLGATVEDVEIGWGPEILEACMDYLGHLFGGALSKELEAHGDLMTPYCRKFAEDALDSTAQRFVETLEVAGHAYRKLGPLLERYDCLICPTNALPAVPADFDPSRDTVTIGGTEVRPELGWVMTTPFNMMSRCPVVSVPSGFAANGVPTGLQIVAPTYRDEIAMQAAMAFEAACGGWYGPGRRPAA